MAVTATDRGHRTTILEVSEKTVASISAGSAPFEEPGMQAPLTAHVNSGLLDATLDQSVASEAEVVLCAIGTGLEEDGSADLSALESLSRSIGAHLSSGVLFVFKTTLPVGTTERMAALLAAASGLSLDDELRVCFSPERIVEGKAMEEMRSLPKIIGGIGPASAAAGASFYETIGGKIIHVSDSRTAELCKLLDNAYRMTRFGFSSDVASLAKSVGVDAYEAITAANAEYSRNSIPLPSMGVSGYCLTKDPLYLDMAAGRISQRRGFPTVWMAARRAADDQMAMTEMAILDAISSTESPVVVLGGLTYKEDVADVRESHGVDLARSLRARGIAVHAWDPCLGDCSVDGIEVRGSAEEALEGADLLAITVPHREFLDLAENSKALAAALAMMRTQRVYDGWGVWRSTLLSSDVTYQGCGLPGR